jgi:hypothetical protein
MKSELEKRLTRQLAAQGHKDAESMAHALLLDRGHINPNGDLTAKGAERDRLGPDGRAKDRASRYAGRAHLPREYEYDQKTNTAKLKK